MSWIIGCLVPGEGRIFLYVAISTLAVSTKSTVQLVMGVLCQEQSFKACVFILCMCSVLNSTANRSECCVSGVLNWSFNYCVLLKQKLQVNDTDVNIQLVVSRSVYCVLLVCVHVTP